MAKFQIIFKGIGIVYSQKEMWKVIFPFDNCHEVKFSSDCKGTPNGSVKGKNRQITITADEPDSSFKIGQDYDNFLDMTDSDMHKAVMKKSDWNEQAVLVSVENAVFSQHELTKCRYIVKLGDKTVKPSAILGYSGRADIEAKSITVYADGVEGFPVTFVDDCTITFDNECYNEETFRDESDIFMTYWAIEDKDDTEKKFTVVRDPADMRTTADNEVLDESIENITIMDNNPGPGEEGLPCHLVRVGNSGDLP